MMTITRPQKVDKFDTIKKETWHTLNVYNVAITLN